MGYRHIDTATDYFNEVEVGKAVRDSGIPREEIFITSKLWIQDYGYEAAKKGIATSLANLDTGWIDLYLLHQPYFDVEWAWKAHIVNFISRQCPLSKNSQYLKPKIITVS